MTVLSEELVNDPLGVGYSSMTPAQQEASLNAPVRIVPRAVPVADIARTVCTTPGMLRRLRTAADNVELPELVRDAADTLSSLCSGRTVWAVVDMADPVTSVAVPAMLSGLVSATVINQLEADALLILGTQSASRATELGLQYVTAGDCIVALGGV